MRVRKVYIHQQNNWPNFYWDESAVAMVLAGVRYKQGRVIGLINTLGFSQKNESQIETLAKDVLKSSEIEGELLDLQQVRSSLARKLGISIAGMKASDRKVDGVVEMMLDATQNYDEPLLKKRMCKWHELLFPTGRNSMYQISIGKYRNDKEGAMQVVSGAMGKEKVHFEAPEAKLLSTEMNAFFSWLNKENRMDDVIKSAIAHLWFVTIHPFDDGNGRIARAISDMLLARSEQGNQRYYSMSASICKNRKQYYNCLEKTQKGNLDITEWLLWFLSCMDEALTETESSYNTVLQKASFHDKHQKSKLNERQRKMVNKLIDGIDGVMNTSKWAKMAKCSQDTAHRDILQLIDLKILKKAPDKGRNTNYILSNIKMK
jgi:Fic family protein